MSLATLDEIKTSQGLAVTQRLEKRRKAIRQAEINGDIKPATILNLSPFDLSLGSGLIQFTVPKCPTGKKFSSKTIDVPLTPCGFTGNEEMADKTVRGKFRVFLILPIQQLMEFKLFYCGSGGEEEGVKQGGVIVFEGTMDGLTPASIVRTPRYMHEGKDRYLVYEEEKLGDLMAQEEENLRIKCLHVLEQAQRWADKGGLQVNNIQRAEHTWADYAVAKKIIPGSPKWRHVTIAQAQQCKRCGKQYVSVVGMCECGHVQEPFVAYMNSMVEKDHVRMGTLTAEEWKKVNAEEERRIKARG
jgi:hypothetical protein